MLSADEISAKEAFILSADNSEDAVKAKEQAIYAIGEWYALRGEGDQLGQLLTALRPFFATIPKARTAKIVRMLIDQVAKIPDSMALQMSLCRESIEWCRAEKRSFLRQRIQTRLAALLLESKQYSEALSLLSALLREVKRLDDKPQLVEINLVESQTHHALRNLPKAKASLTAARTAANAIYCPPLLQAQIDVMAGTLHAEEKDFKTAFSYFYESFENFDSVSSTRAVDCLKYMLLCKVMMNVPEEVSAIVNGKPGIRHSGPALEAMRAVASAHQQRSLHDFEAALQAHQAQFRNDPIISRHLDSLYDMLLQENICRIIEPYSVVETSHIATLMNLPLATIESKLSHMILDKKFKGILDAGAGCLIVYDDQAPDTTYNQALETIGNMGGVVDALYEKAQQLAVTKA
jgi:26S proteasome regulatory subunit N6